MRTKTYLKISFGNAAFFTLLALLFSAVTDKPALPVMLSTFAVVFIATLWACALCVTAAGN